MKSHSFWSQIRDSGNRTFEYYNCRIGGTYSQVEEGILGKLKERDLRIGGNHCSKFGPDSFAVAENEHADRLADIPT